MMNDRSIMVIQRDVLFSKMHFDGFLYSTNFDFETIILNNYSWMEQSNAEKNQFFKQPVGYTILCNFFLKKVYVYQRSSKDEHYAEKRLQGKYSCGVGGHVEKLDITSNNPIVASTIREVKEEVDINAETVKVLGYINDDSDDVGKVHFGILYLLETSAEVINHKDVEIAKGELLDIKEFEKICNDPEFRVENWSKIALTPLKKYLSID
jgi:predicted NUDIX family phosphoesterase